MKQLIIVGTGGHGRVVADAAKRSGLYETVAFLDDAAPAKDFAYPYLGKIEDFPKYKDTCHVVVAIGNNPVRERITRLLKAQGAKMATVVDPNAIIGSNVKIGPGSVILPRAVVNTGTVIGEGVIINTASTLDHDCVVGDFSHIAVGASLAGAVNVGTRTWIDAGAVVKTHIRICDDCKIEVGSAVNCDLNEAGSYTGVPAKKTN